MPASVKVVAHFVVRMLTSPGQVPTEVPESNQRSQVMYYLATLACDYAHVAPSENEMFLILLGQRIGEHEGIILICLPVGWGTETRHWHIQALSAKALLTCILA